MSKKRLGLTDLKITSFVTAPRQIRGGCTHPQNCFDDPSCNGCTGGTAVVGTGTGGTGSNNATCGASCGCIGQSEWATCPGGACPSNAGQFICV